MAEAVRRTRVALVGAGFIARSHLEALRWIPGVAVTALCDPVRERAEGLARAFRVGRVVGGLEELLGEDLADAVHIAVPPEAHVAVARRCLLAGRPCLVEKPLALGSAQARELGALARSQGLALGVNHNLTFVPGVPRLARELEQGRLGRLEHLVVVHNTPLRQLLTGDVGHFMFQAEANILWEQGVHLFSLVHRLLGPCRELRVADARAIRLPNGAPFRDRWSLFLECERGTAQVFLAFGRTMPETSITAVATDGLVRVDLLRATYRRLEKTRWLDCLDQTVNGVRGGLALLGQGLAAVGGYGLALFHRVPPSDPFSRGMLGSLAAFHAALRQGREPDPGAGAAASVAAMVELAAAGAGLAPAPEGAMPLPGPGPARPGEVVVTGGAGFLGRHLVPRLKAAGRPVTLLVRRPGLLRPELRDPEIRLFPGDARDPEAVGRAVAGAAAVIHLATCAAAEPAGMEAAMAGGVRVVGEACLAAGVGRLLFVSSTAALYLGGRAPVPGGSGPDPQPRKRPEYARGKIAAEGALQALVRERGLAAAILRPAIVVGAGGLAEHSGVGLWTRDNHCVGWGAGLTPLPLVLARDVAAALVAALAAPLAPGSAFDLAGEVRLTAREYVRELRAATGRAFSFHPQPLWSLWLVENLKYALKRLAGRAASPLAWRDLKSRAFLAPLDTAAVRKLLGWAPEADPERFRAEAFRVHGPGGDGAP